MPYDKNQVISMEFTIEKMMGDSCLANGDIKGALNQTEICIAIAAEHYNTSMKLHEIAYKSYVELAKTFYVKHNDKEGAIHSLNYALKHQKELYQSLRPGIKEELLDYIKGKRVNFPLK